MHICMFILQNVQIYVCFALLFRLQFKYFESAVGLCVSNYDYFGSRTAAITNTTNGIYWL